ncbi:MAG TPA: hypothetical protein GXZ61_01290 [Clostridiales bacterium]|jgi:hypothetical protein|nr:hypothetical protein [Clostridiales bacterium]
MLKKVAVIASGIAAALVTVLMFLLLEGVIGGRAGLLIGEAIALALYLGAMLLIKVNRKGFAYVLISAFAALMLSDLALLLIFFRTGEYYNYGIAGLYYALLTYIAVFAVAGVVVSIVNRKIR